MCAVAQQGDEGKEDEEDKGRAEGKKPARD